MKGRILIIFLLAFLGCENTKTSQEPVYDQALAEQLGADEMGMKNYTLVILKTGPAVIEDKALRDSLFAGHFSNMSKMSDAGKLILAGPLAQNEQTYRGIFILDTISEEEIRELLSGDPTIANGIFEVELFTWYGSAALPSYLEVQKKIQKQEL
ncbi:MAG: YciI family protein [Bacteroides sp.]|nr:YciI family protein [Bacteroides sp.]